MLLAKFLSTQKGLRLYHGSDVLVESPRMLQPLRALDFGEGFYTTTNEGQARSFAKRVQELSGSAAGRISVYSLNFELLGRQKALFFGKPDKKWLDFVSAHRNEVYAGEVYDVIYGPVANDTIFKTFVAYQNGILSERDTLRRLRIRPLYNQLVFTNEESLRCLSFAGELS